MPEVPLTDADWSRIAHLFPVQPVAGRGRPRSHPRALLNGILWVLMNGQSWRLLPATFPPQQTCYNRWLEWRKTGIMEAVRTELGISQTCWERAANALESGSGQAAKRDTSRSLVTLMSSSVFF